ncbi:MAG: DedA family protein [Bdellovibrionales bacterium]
MNEFQIFFDHLHDPAFLAHRYGEMFYIITFFWTAFEGETFVVIAGFLAQKGYLNIYELFVAAWLGSCVGDQVVFMLGRRYGERILKNFPRIKPKIDRATGWIDKHAVAFILCYRFVYGVRNVSGVALGLSHVSWRKFAIWNAIAAFVWALSFSGFGYLFGDVSDAFHKQEDVSYGVREVMLSGLALFAIILAVRFAIKRCCREKNHASKKNHKGVFPKIGKITD